MSFDPFLYVALALGIVAGRFLPHPGAWTGRATLVTVGILVGLLGASLDAVGVDALALSVPISLGFALLVLGLTAAVYLVLAGRGARETKEGSVPPSSASRRFPWLSIALLAALVGGYAVGRFVELSASSAIPYALYALLALVGFDLRFRWNALGRVWVPLASAAVAAVGAAIAFAAASGIALSISLATTFAFGWYTLAGPLVVARAGAALGLLAFLTNFLRENLSMVLSPVLGRRLRGPGLTALGGATAMDTTLYFITRFGDEESASLALASGLVLTLAASLLLPLLLALPQ